LVPHKPLDVHFITTDKDYNNTLSGDNVRRHLVVTSQEMTTLLDACDTVWLDANSKMDDVLEIIIESLVQSKIRSIVVTGWENTRGISEEADVTNHNMKRLQDTDLPLVFLYKCFFWEDLPKLIHPYELEEEGEYLKVNRLSWKLPLQIHPPIQYGISSSDFGKCLSRILLDPVRYIGKHIKPCGEEISIINISEFISHHLKIKVELPSDKGIYVKSFDFIRNQDHAKEINPDTQVFYNWLKSGVSKFV
jgi:hypothetical protein